MPINDRDYLLSFFLSFFACYAALLGRQQGIKINIFFGFKLHVYLQGSLYSLNLFLKRLSSIDQDHAHELILTMLKSLMLKGCKGMIEPDYAN